MVNNNNNNNNNNVNGANNGRNGNGPRRNGAGRRNSNRQWRRNNRRFNIRRSNGLGYVNRRFINRKYALSTSNNMTMSNKYLQMRVNAPAGLGYNVENAQNSTITIRRTGYLHTVVASLAFKVAAYNIHPSILPWMKTLSQLYDKYKFVSFSARYMGQSSSTSAGTVFLAYDYDPHTGLPDSMWKTQAYDKFVSCPVWSTSSWVSITRNILTDKWYDCDVTNSNDDSWHDKFPARLIYGTYGGGNSTNISVGQIEISYTVRLSRPTFNGSEIAPAPDVTFVSNLDTDGNIGGIESVSQEVDSVIPGYVQSEQFDLCETGSMN